MTAQTHGGQHEAEAEPVQHSIPPEERKVRQAAVGPTRTSWTWVFLVVALILGIALVDFLVQNSRSTRIEFFWASGRVPLTAALLVAALAGAAVVLVVGVMRMIQLRRGLRAGKGSALDE